MIGFKGQEKKMEQVVTDLLDPTFPRCWNLVLPPGFGDILLGQGLAHGLKHHPRRPLVALVSPDTIQNPMEFVQDLYHQWNRCRGDRRELKAPSGNKPSVALNELLGTVASAGPPVVLILQRFHTILDRLEDWVLGLLRNEEQAYRLRTVTLTPMPHDVIKMRWQHLGHFFCTSDYGDTHSCHLAEPLDSLDEVVQTCAAQTIDIPPGIAKYLMGLTGAFPEPFWHALGSWVKHQRPGLDRPVREFLRREVGGRKDWHRFVRWLDPLDTKDYRELVINLHLGIEPEESYQRLSSHPWEQILLDGTEGLRAECIGRAAIADAVRGAGVGGALRTVWSDPLERALSMYGRRQYHLCLELLKKIERRPPRAHVRFLEAHSQVMSQIYGGDGSDLVGGDTDWRKTRQAVCDAQRILEEAGEVIPEADRVLLAHRYQELEHLAVAVLDAAGVQGPLSGRYVDILGGLVEDGNPDPVTAALLLVVRSEALKTIDGDETACQEALPLPEQIFRIWAQWRLDLNFYRAPADCDSVWEHVARHWPVREYGEPHRPEPGKSFNSLPVFAYFAMALWRQRTPTDDGSAPEHDFKSLQSALSLYDAVRTGRAHALCLPSRRQRERYFALIDRWLDKLLQACRPEPVTRQQLLTRIEPLPIVTEDGGVLW